MDLQNESCERIAINEMKLVSIGMPVYNGEAHVRASLNSLLSQTHDNFELIISDDASNDKSAVICEDYAVKDKRIKFFAQKENLGLVKNFAFVLKQAKGEYFMWAAQDDWWEKTFLEKMAFALDKNPDYVVAMSYFKILNESGGIEETPLGKHEFTSLSNPKLFKKILKAKDNPIFEYGLWRREFLSSLFARLKPESIEDTVILMSEAALAGKFYSVPEFLHVKYRNPKPLRERHYLKKYYDESRPYTKFIFIMLTWLLSSRIIPLRRKFYIFGPWLTRAWTYKRKIIKEIINFGRR